MKTEHAIDWRKTASEIQDDYERVCKERDEYKQDAERYRWLKENIRGGSIGTPIGWFDDDVSGWDKDIDAAMEKVK